ncbi:MAG: LTA synthase family protein, partial [Clostridiales bacterium]|nr:LTA synthase family protein [Clostridiales bacterium]
SLIIIVFMSLLTTGFMFYISPGSVMTFMQMTARQPLLFILNYAPVLLVMLFVYFLTGNCIFSSGIPMMVFLAGAFANRTKINLRQDPMVPSDLEVITEVKSLLSSYGDFYINLAIGALVIVILICVLAFVFVRKSYALTLKKRVIGCAGCFLCFMLMFTTVYSSSDLYDSFEVDGNIYFKVNQYISKGYLYSFIYDIHSFNVSKPEGYTAAEFTSEYDNVSYEEFDDISKPNVIMIMSEAFSDISNSDLISFEGYDDPLEFFNSFVERDDVISGHIVVPNFGGGTSDTEFDVLTACSTKYIDSSQVSYNFVRRNMEALPSLLERVGYDTLAIHPGYGWFYNRTNVFENMGFDDFLYLEEDFDPETQNKGGYISDAVTTESIIENFEAYVSESDDPLFEFCVTIQNHGPYEEKYNDLETNFSTDVELTDTEKAIYSGYFEGIDDADAQIEALVNYFETSEEPVVLVFFGDHLPGFSNDMSYFSQFRSDIDLNGNEWQQIKGYETPYFIWANEAARNMTNFDSNRESLYMPEDNVISSFYLGAYVMELLDMGDISPLFSYVNEMRTVLPIASTNWYVYADGTLATEIDGNELEMVQKYKRWIYYKLFDDEVVFND